VALRARFFVTLAAAALVVAVAAAVVRLRNVELIPVGSALRDGSAVFVAERVESAPAAGGAVLWTIDLRVANESARSSFRWDPRFTTLLDETGTVLELDASAPVESVELAAGAEHRCRLVYRAAATVCEPRLRIYLEQQPLLNLVADLRWGRRAPEVARDPSSESRVSDGGGRSPPVGG
jgi:hypothetical protein